MPDRHHVVAPRISRFLAVASVLMFGMLALITTAYAGDAASLIGKFTPGSKVTVKHDVWDRLLKTYVKTDAHGLNRIDYAAFKNGGQNDLKRYIATLEKTNLGALDRPEQFALLANLYNAKTIDIVLDHYPVGSIKDISLGGGFLATLQGGPWKAKVVMLSGMKLSLDDIEHDMLRKVFRDARVHYAVNCASIGCPNLQNHAMTGANLDASLDTGARAYVNSSRGVNITRDGVYVSSIYRWFKADFGGNDSGVLKHLKRYAAPKLATRLRAAGSIAGDRYDWHLNDVKR